VIVAIVGNATEHGSAVVLARRGRVKLAVEISMASSAQIAGLLIPLVVLISWAFDPLALSFRPIELVAIAVAAVLPALVLRTGRTTRLGGAVLLFAYSLLVVCFICPASAERPTVRSLDRGESQPLVEAVDPVAADWAVHTADVGRMAGRADVDGQLRGRRAGCEGRSAGGAADIDEMKVWMLSHRFSLVTAERHNSAGIPSYV
jgi:hypothetical protein